MRRILVLVAVFATYVALMTFGGCADRLILFPTTAPIAGHGAEFRLVKWDGGEVEVLVSRPWGARGREPVAFMLEFTGNATRAEHIVRASAEQFDDRPVEVWVVNYPGYGQSTGPARLKSIPPSARAVFDELKREAGERPIVVAGRSLGTTAALHVAASRAVDGMIIHNPIPLRSMILRRFGWWNLWLIAGPVAMAIPAELDAINNARRVTVPAVFILHGADEVVPPSYQRRVVDAYAGEMRMIQQPNARHNDMITADGRRELKDAINWLLRDVAVEAGRSSASP